MSTEPECPPNTTEQWEQKLAQSRAVNEELQRRRAEAEKDRDLFRTLYGSASTHACSVTSENNQLERRATLAEGQARDGVAMLKATYEERIHLLEQEVARWKSQCHILTERDSRMDDDIRKRAALEPELRAENEKLREQLERLEEDYARLEGLLDGMTRHHAAETSELEPAMKDGILASVEVSCN